MSRLVSSIPKRTLGKTKLNVSSIGMGGTTFGNMYDQFNSCSFDDCYKILQYALNSNINIIDTAPLYGLNQSETVLGKILSQFHENGSYPRDSYVLCSKIGRYDITQFDYSAKRTEQSIEESLNRLQTDYIDIINVHDFELNPNGLEQIWNETLPYLYENKGIKYKYIGLSGQQLIVMDYVAQQFGYDKLDTFLTYNNYNIPDMKLLNYVHRLKKYDIGIIQGGASYHGLLTDKGPQSWFPHRDAFRICGNIANEEIKQISRMYYGNKYDQDALSRLAFLFTHELEDIATVLIGPTTLEELQRSIDYLTDYNCKEEDDYDDMSLNDNDEMMIEYLQSNVFADIMNIGTVEKGAEDNVIKATLANVIQASK